MDIIMPDELGLENLFAEADKRMNLYESKAENTTPENITAEAWGHLHAAFRYIEVIKDLYHIQNGKLIEASARLNRLIHTPLADASKRRYAERERNPDILTG